MRSEDEDNREKLGRQQNSPLTHATLLLVGFIARRAGRGVSRGWDGRRWPLVQVIDDRSGSRQTQVTPIMIDALHLALAGLGDGEALVDICGMASLVRGGQPSPESP